jgi:hypothetical protein
MKRLMTGLAIATPLLVAALPATAAPQIQPLPSTSVVEPARADCRWVDNKWTYQRGDKRIVCRPNRPSGRDWTWRREGPRFGWYNNSRRAWNYNAW